MLPETYPIKDYEALLQDEGSLCLYGRSTAFMNLWTLAPYELMRKFNAATEQDGKQTIIIMQEIGRDHLYTLCITTYV